MKAHLSIIVLFCITFVFSGKAFAVTAESICPDKTYDTVTFEGIYPGWIEPEEGMENVLQIIVENNEIIHILASPEKAQKYFGKNKNIKVQVTYDVVQFYDGHDGYCRRIQFLKSGKILDVIKSEPKASGDSLTGTYVSKEEEFNGTIILRSGKNNTYQIELETIRPRLDGLPGMCYYEGKCILKNGILNCDDPELNDDDEMDITIHVINKELSVAQYQVGVCGVGGYANGKYVKK